MTPLTRLKLSNEALVKLQKYLIEILTYTLAADFSLVSRALSRSGLVTRNQKVASILVEDEKKELLRLASIVQSLHQKYLSNQWNLTLDCDRETVRHTIIVPAKSWHINMDYILDIISTYTEYVKWELT